jgi:hypothetical protein
MSEPPALSPAAPPDGGRGTRRWGAAGEVLLVGGLSLALIGYAYVIGWVITWVRLAAAQLPAAPSLPAMNTAVIFAVGARAVLVMVVVFAAMCAFAYAVHWRRWDRRSKEWTAIVNTTRARERLARIEDGTLTSTHLSPATFAKALAPASLQTGATHRLGALKDGVASEIKRTPKERVARAVAAMNVAPEDALIRVIAGFNVGVLAVALGLVGARFFRTVIDQWQPGHWWALLLPWTVFSTVLAWLLGKVNPLRGGPFVHGLLWTAVIVVAMISSAPVGILVSTWMGVGALGRQFGGRALPRSTFAFLRSPLPWLLLTIYALVALSYAAMPPVSFPQTIVETSNGTRLGGYVGRTGSGIYLAHCSPLADATSLGDSVQLVPATAIRSVTSTNADFTLDSGYRPSLPTLVLHALGIDTQTVAWIRPEVKERHAPCAGSAPPRPSAASDAGELGAGIYGGPAPSGGLARDGEQPIERRTVAPRIAVLAKRFQPTVLTSIADPFWPVSVGAVLEDVGAGSNLRRTCVRANRPGSRCAPGAHATLADLATPANDSPDYLLEYPVTPALTRSPEPQLEAFLRGQRGVEVPVPSRRQILADPAVLDPWATGQVYFYFAGRARGLKWPLKYPAAAERETRLVAYEYWFFYPYNYFPTLVKGGLMEDSPIAADVANTDLHQGDWEHVVVLVEPRRAQPRWLYTARHASEGVFYPWSSPSLGFEGMHPVVQAAYGGHPSYPAACGARPRYINPLKGRVSDWLVCGPGRFALRAPVTPLVDLATTSWACWKGHFGAPTRDLIQRAAQSASAVVSTLARELKNYVFVAGPRSPLWQGENGHLAADDGENERKPDVGPCLDLGGPTAREREAEREGIERAAPSARPS